MERISKELIRKGIENKTITFDMDADQSDQCIAYIGDYWFYISSPQSKKAEDCTTEELVGYVYEAINDEPINDDNDDDATECLYYKAVLEERLGLVS